MFEDTNQALRLDMQFFSEDVDTDTTDDLGDDYENLFVDDETTDETSENSDETTEETTDETTDETTETPAFIEVNHLKNKYELDKAAAETVARGLGVSVDQLPALIQKGLNYEHKNNREMQLLKEYAEINGVPVEAYINELERQKSTLEYNRIYERELAQAQAQNPGVNRDVLVAQADAKAKLHLQNFDQQRREREAREAEDSKRPFIELFTAHPDLTPESVPTAVLDRIKAGETPLFAYRSYTLEQEKAELQIKLEEAQRLNGTLQQNNDNKQKAVGSAAGKEAEDDPFLAGLNSAFS